MKSFHKELWFNVQERMDFINITRDVESAISESGIKEGLCLVNAMHITASVFINDDESGLHRDYKSWLENLAPHEPLSRYDHNLTGKITATLTTSVRSWAERLSLPLPKVTFILAHGNRYFTESLTAAEKNEF